MQNGNTQDDDLRRAASWCSYVSHFMTLHPGDIISTGTPPGVGIGKKPTPVFLQGRPDDAAAVDGLGEQTQRVVEG